MCQVSTMISSPKKEFIPDEAEGKSLGELWLDYLMNETEAPEPQLDENGQPIAAAPEQPGE